MAATIIDVAQHAGVGVSTAARAISGDGYVAPNTRQRVLESAQTLGYVSNRIARSLRTRSTRTLGLLIADVENPFYSVIAKNVESAAKVAGYHVMLCNDNDNPVEEREYLTILEGLGVDGLLVTPTASNRAHLERLWDRGLWVVQIDRKVPGLRADTVVADNEAGAAAAVDHLVENGHREIGIFAGPANVMTGKRRLNGFRSAMKRHGLTVPDARVQRGSFQRDHAALSAREFLERPDRPSAIFAANNVLAEGCVVAAEELGLRIPEDLSLVAFDDMPWMALTSPKITAVRQPVADMARSATDLVLQRLRDSSREPTTVVFQPQLVARQSVAAPAHRGRRRTAR